MKDKAEFHNATYWIYTFGDGLQYGAPAAHVYLKSAGFTVAEAQTYLNLLEEEYWERTLGK